MRIHSVWDNGGVTSDRYTIVTTENLGSDVPFAGKGWERKLGLVLSDNCTSPQGVSQWVEVPNLRIREGAPLGKRIKWLDLPKDVRKHARERMREDA